MTKLALIGFGEAGQALAEGWAIEDLTAFDIALDRAKCATLGVKTAASPAEAVAEAEAVFCVVTADQALVAAEAAAPHLPVGCLWFDCNSCAPGSKQRAADRIEAGGGRYVDTAIMSPIHPERHRAPMLLGGPHAGEAHALAERLDMRTQVCGAAVGQASTIKMLRSVMIKGIEALTAESLLAARKAGVEDEVLASLDATDPGASWRARTSNNLERMMVHGVRRAAEMAEVAKTLRELGLPDRMAVATEAWHADIGNLSLDPGGDDMTGRADTILSRIE